MLHDNPTEEDRLKLEALLPSLSGALLSIWLPFDWGRRIVMICLFAVGIYGFCVANYYLVLAWLVMLAFSPRFVGEAAFLWGVISAKFAQGYRDGRKI